MIRPHSERYSPDLCQATQRTLRELASADLAALLPALERRGGQGLTLLRLELRRRARTSL